MSLGIVFKGPEGIVLAADSRVTLTGERQEGTLRITIPATFDNATKLLNVSGQDYVGAVTYGLGALGQQEPRTAHSFIPEFETKLAGMERLSAEEFAQQLSDFFMQQWTDNKMPDADQWKADPMIFLVAGYDVGAAYGRVFQVQIPSMPRPVEQIAGQGIFGLSWGGQTAFVDRLLTGFDSRMLTNIQQKLNLDQNAVSELGDFLRQNFSASIPYQFLPLQDCIDLSIFLIRTTINLQTWLLDVRGVGGAIDVATITRTQGFDFLQRKAVRGETI